MRRRTFREVAAMCDRGEIRTTPEEDAEDERDERLCHELAQLIREKAMLPFLREHPNADWTVVGPAVISVAAIHCMAQAKMSPADFAVIAERVATDFEADAREIRKRAEGVS